MVLRGDLANRLHGGDFRAFYTDEGMLPRAAASAILILLPPFRLRFRTWAAAGAIVFHAGIALFMTLG